MPLSVSTGRSLARPEPAVNKGWTHALSYRGRSPAAFVHRARLHSLVRILRSLDLPSSGTLVDFGCSDGHITAQLRSDQVIPDGWRIVGYDISPRLVKLARARELADAEFHVLDLNEPADGRLPEADLAISLETLEHVGDYRNALRVITGATRGGGQVVLSMPNEIGVVGLVKFLARPLLRRNPYAGFFPSRTAVARYLVYVAARRDIEQFRRPARQRWGPHLGFDHRRVRSTLTALLGDAWVVERCQRSGFGANYLLVLRRQAGPGSATG